MNRKHEKYEQLLARAQAIEPVATAVAHPCDEASLHAALEAARLRLIVPLLVGPRARMESIAAAHKLSLEGIELVDTPHSHASSSKRC